MNDSNPTKDKSDSRQSNIVNTEQSSSPFVRKDEPLLKSTQHFLTLTQEQDQRMKSDENLKENEGRLRSRSAELFTIQEDLKKERTERKKIEQQLFQYQSIVESSSDGIFSKTLDGTIVSWNTGSAKMYGYSAEEMIGQNVAMIIPPDRPTELEFLLKKVRSGRLVKDYETIRLTRSGQRIHVSLTISPIRDSRGKIIGASTIARDITERKKSENALIESEERFRKFFDEAPIGVTLAGPNLEIQRANKAFCKLIGYRPKELMHKRFLDLTHPDDKAKNAELATALERGDIKDYQLEKRYIHKNGRVVWVNLTVTNVYRADHTRLYALGMIVDITHRKQAEATLRASEDQFRKTFDDAPIGMRMVGANNRFINVNRVFCKITGYTREELRQRTYLSITYPLDAKIEAELAKQLYDGLIPSYQLEKRFIHKQGHIIWVNSSCTLIRDHQGRPLYILGMIEDITKRKETVERLRESEERFSRVFARSPIPIGITRLRDGRFIDANESLMARLGFHKDEIIGKTVTDLGIYPDPKDRTKILQSIKKNGALYGEDMKYRTKAGGTIEAVAYMETIELRGEPCLISMFEDVTERKRAEQNLRESEERFSLVFKASRFPIALIKIADNKYIDVNDSFLKLTEFSRDEVIGHATQDLNTSVDELDPVAAKEAERIFMKEGALYDIETKYRTKSGAIRMAIVHVELIELKSEPCMLIMFEDITERKEIEMRKNDFISIASHELKTPLTSLKAFTQLLEKQLCSSSDEQSLLFLNRMNSQLDKLNDLVTDMLDVSRIEGGKLVFRQRKFNLGDLVLETVHDVQCTCTSHLLALTGSITHSVNADHDRIEQVITNLLTNAIKYSPEAKSVIIHMKEKDGQAIVSVKDYGIGIYPEEMDKVFERFFRSDNRSKPGLGLGLYIAHEIIERHGGKLWVESQSGKGSTFYFSLPLVVSPSS